MGFLDKLEHRTDFSDTWYKCTICGREGRVGRCCGDETRKPLNALARNEQKRLRSHQMITPTRITDETAPQFLENLRNRVYMVVWVCDHNNHLYATDVCYMFDRDYVFITDSYVLIDKIDIDMIKSRIHSYLVCSEPTAVDGDYK